MSRQFGSGVDMSGHGLTVEHLGALENLKCVLMLAKKEAGGVGGDVDAQKMMNGTEISHGELTRERRDERCEEGSGAGSEDDVIEI